MKQQDLSPEVPDELPDWRLLIDKLAEIESRLATMPLVFPSDELSDDKLAVIATSISRSRRRRLGYFDETLFGEPAWDMLLELFVTKALGRRIGTTSLCIAAEVPQATGLRHIGRLEAKGLVRRVTMADDRRVTVVELTPLGYKQMRRYVVDGIGRFDLPPVD